MYLHCSLAEPYTHILGEGEDHLTPTGKIDLGAGSKTWKMGCELASEALTSLPSASPAKKGMQGCGKKWEAQRDSSRNVLCCSPLGSKSGALKQAEGPATPPHLNLHPEETKAREPREGASELFTRVAHVELGKEKDNGGYVSCCPRRQGNS